MHFVFVTYYNLHVLFSKFYFDFCILSIHFMLLIIGFQKMMFDSVSLYAITVLKLTFSTLLKIFPSYIRVRFFQFAIRCLISIRLDALLPSTLQVLHVSVNRQAHCRKCR